MIMKAVVIHNEKDLRIEDRDAGTPGPGQVGDFTVLATVSDGRNSTTNSFVLRVVADASANAPKLLVNLTPSTPVLPGQVVLATVRADAFSPIASITVQARGAGIG